jgi:hypothetical protein
MTGGVRHLPTPNVPKDSIVHASQSREKTVAHYRDKGMRDLDVFAVATSETRRRRRGGGGFGFKYLFS